MLDIDYAPGVFAVIIGFVFVLPALYGLLLVDKHWKKHKEAVGEEDAFN